MNQSIYKHEKEFVLESGQSLPLLEVGYQTFGVLNQSKDNVVWVCHALTANTAVDDWWSGSFGSGKLIDPNRHFIICANLIGSCYGSTNALSINPISNTPYYHDFPIITIRDSIKAFDSLRKHLNIDSIEHCIGGSLGGMHALEWAIYKPTIFKRLTLLATNAKNSAWAIGLNESQRMAIKADQTWMSDNADAGKKGLEAARSIALLSYRNHAIYEKTQADEVEKLDDFKASSYQQYQGQKLSSRFDAFCYWTLTKSLDTHNVGRGEKSVIDALKKIKADTLVIGLSSDLLFPTTEQQFIAQHIDNAHYYEISSLYGHDGFLIEHDAILEATKKYHPTF